MTWGAVATGAGTVLGGILGSSSAQSAAETQANAAREAAQAQLQATRESNQLQQQMYLSNLGLQRPGIQAGQTALAALTGGLGLNVNYNRATPIGPSGITPTTGQPTYINSQGQTVDSTGKVVTPMQTMPDVSQYGATPQEQQQASQQFAGQFQKTFNPSDLTTDPSYKWRLEQGLKALQARGAATGMLQTGQGLRDITDYSQGLASTEYQSAYDRFMKNQEALYGRLAGIAGIGQGAVSGAGQLGQSVATNVGQATIGGARAASDYLTSGAAARAAGTVGSTQALTGGLNQAGQNWITLQYLNKLNPQAPVNVLPGGVGSGTSPY